MAASAISHNPTSTFESAPVSAQKGRLRAYDVSQIVPSSHAAIYEHKGVKIAAIVALAIFLGSIICWAVGASTGVAGLEIVGKVFFGLSISVIALAIIGLVALCCICKDNL